MQRYRLLFFLFLLPVNHVRGALVISEVADKGSSSVCGGAADWIEIYNDGTEQVSLAGFVLHDDNGPMDADAFYFPQDFVLLENEYKVLCCDDDPANPQFGIGGDDTVTLLDAQGNTVSSVGPLLGRGAFDVSFALFESGFEYTMEPTPGAPNVLLPLPEEETPEEKATRLVAQNAMGTRFFGMDEYGYPVSDGMEDVLDLKLVMTDEDYQYITQHSWHEEYRPFTSGKLLQRSNGEEVASLDSPGRLRPKGQSTLYFSICLGIPSIPFSIDFDDTNKTQTLFGAGRVYLRNKLSDRSYLREWAFHRMLARFGLPHLRTRTIRFYLNEQYMGLYDLMEAPDSEYVFYRTFPGFDFENFALYKIKTASTSCGKKKYYNETSIAEAMSRINETTPYLFDTGDHRADVAVLGDAEACSDGFNDILLGEKRDAVLAYVRNDQNCGEMLLNVGLVDRDLGVSSWDPTMADFINTHLSNSTCETACAGSNLANEVNVTNFLRNFAVFSTVMHQDSPIGNGNNYCLAQTGTGGGWNMVPYDMDNAATRVGVQICDDQCANRMVHWSITRPTCTALEENQLAGPLLSDPTLHSQYLEYVREFVTDVLGDESFLQEIANHAAAIEQDVVSDPWNTFYSHDYSSELSSTAAAWYSPGNPFLAVLRARVDDVLSQLDALDAGNYSDDTVEAEQVCVDWRGDNLVPDSCYNNCEYDGCYEPSWTVTGVCDMITGICYHGQYDENCAGIPNGETYSGMEQREGEAVFCQDMVALSACLPAQVTQVESTPLPTTQDVETTVVAVDPTTGTDAAATDKPPTTAEPIDGTNTATTKTPSTTVQPVMDQTTSGPTPTPAEGASLITPDDSSTGIILSTRWGNIVVQALLLVICVLS